MAHDRPVSRHGVFDSFRGMQVENAGDVYHKQDTRPRSSRPKSALKKRASSDYDKYARDVPGRDDIDGRPTSGRGFHGDPFACPPSPQPSIGPPTRPDSLEGLSRARPATRSTRARLSQDFSDEQHHPLSRQCSDEQHRPLSRQFSVEQQRPLSRQSYMDPPRPESRYADPRDFPSLPASRPTSALNQLRPLPDIGDSASFADPWNQYNANTIQSLLPPNKLLSPHSPTSPNTPRNNFPSSNRVPSAVSDISVISSKASSSSRRKQEESAAAHLIERLDLSQLNKPPEIGRKKKSVNHSSPSHRVKSASQPKSKYDSGELYDGDDDDSDSYPSDSKDAKDSNSRVSSREPVVIPSENGLPSSGPEQDILLAIRLPTDGSRHQRYFQRFETLMAILEFAEEQAGQDFAGYILVSGPPRTTYEVLRQTISEAGLKDKTMLHLEEKD